MLGYDVVSVGAVLARMRVGIDTQDNGASIAVITKVRPVTIHSNAALTDKNANGKVIVLTKLKEVINFLYSFFVE